MPLPTTPEDRRRAAEAVLALLRLPPLARAEALRRARTMMRGSAAASDRAGPAPVAQR